MLVDMSGRRQKRKGCSEAPAITKYLRVTSESSSQVQAEQNRRTPHYVRRHQPSCRWTRTCIPAYSVSRTPLCHRLATGLFHVYIQIMIVECRDHMSLSSCVSFISCARCSHCNLYLTACQFFPHHHATSVFTFNTERERGGGGRT